MNHGLPLPRSTEHDSDSKTTCTDPETPNVARIYDYLLGGKDNYAADRAAAGRLIEVLPGAAKAARANRDFLIRTIRHLAGETGISQFLDIGTGYPAHTNVHDVAQAIRPGARVLYTDSDPVVIAHANARLADTATVTAMHADLRLPSDLLDSPAVQEFIDFAQPVTVLMTGILHFIEDHEKPALLADYIKTRMAAGSYLVISHAVSNYLSWDTIEAAEAIFQNTSAPCTFRTISDVTRFFDGLDMMPPGLVNVADWHYEGLPRRHANQHLIFGGIGRKPANTGMLA